MQMRRVKYWLQRKSTYTRVRPLIVDRDSGQDPVRLLLFNLLTCSKHNVKVIRIWKQEPKHAANWTTFNSSILQDPKEVYSFWNLQIIQVLEVPQGTRYLPTECIVGEIKCQKLFQLSYGSRNQTWNGIVL